MNYANRRVEERCAKYARYYLSAREVLRRIEAASRRWGAALWHAMRDAQSAAGFRRAAGAAVVRYAGTQRGIARKVRAVEMVTVH